MKLYAGYLALICWLMPLNMIVYALKCEGNRISLWFSNVHHLEIIQKQFVMIPSLAKPHMRWEFCTLVLSLLKGPKPRSGHGPSGPSTSPGPQLACSESITDFKNSFHQQLPKCRQVQGQVIGLTHVRAIFQRKSMSIVSFFWFLRDGSAGQTPAFHCRPASTWPIILPCAPSPLNLAQALSGWQSWQLLFLSWTPPAPVFLWE